jgi:hypothetical protein
MKEGLGSGRQIEDCRGWFSDSDVAVGLRF